MSELNDTITSFIRTYVPIVVGSFLVILNGWLNKHHVLWIHIDSQQAVAWATAVVIGLYYLVARILEKKFPKLGILLGSVKKPAYGLPGQAVQVDPTIKKAA